MPQAEIHNGFVADEAQKPLIWGSKAPIEALARLIGAWRTLVGSSNGAIIGGCIGGGIGIGIIGGGGGIGIGIIGGGGGIGFGGGDCIGFGSGGSIGGSIGGGGGGSTAAREGYESGVTFANIEGTLAMLGKQLGSVGEFELPLFRNTATRESPHSIACR